MSQPSLAELQAWFQHASRSLGWDMIVAYDRRTLNGLMLQQYIERFSAADHLPLVSESLVNDSNTEHVLRLQLRAPRVSFEGDDPTSSKLQLSMDFIGGLIMTEVHGAGSPPHISVLRQVQPVGGPRLTMAIPLEALKALDDQRAIVLDLGQAMDFSASFALDTLSQEEIGLRFKVIFERLADGPRVFGLGRFADDISLPKNLRLWIMPAPSGSDVGGALMMLVRIVRQTDGKLPLADEGYLYPIPADTPQTPFSITVMSFPDEGKQRPVTTPPQRDEPFPILYEDLFFGDHLQVAIHALAINPQFFAMAQFGHIGTRDSAFSVDPLEPFVKAGDRLQFSTTPAASAVSWSVRSTDGDERDLGVISASGLYTAPSAASLVDGCKTVVVTARGQVGGSSSAASALVSIVQTSIAASPRFVVCGAARSIDMTADVLPGNPGQALWSLRNPAQAGHLSERKGRSCRYTAADVGDGGPNALYMDLVDVRNSQTGEMDVVQVLVIAGFISLPLFISEASEPETNRVKFQTRFEGETFDLDDLDCELALLVDSGGEIGADLAFSAPADATGFAVVHLKVRDDRRNLHGFMVLPLPLWAYADLITRASNSIRQHAQA